MALIILSCLIALVAAYIYAALFINRAKDKKATIGNLRIGQEVFVHNTDGKILQLPIIGLTLNEVQFGRDDLPSVPVELIFLTLEAAKQVRIKVMEKPVASQMEKPAPKKNETGTSRKRVRRNASGKSK